jgi:hypothetical protein
MIYQRNEKGCRKGGRGIGENIYLMPIVRKRIKFKSVFYIFYVSNSGAELIAVFC